MRIFAAHTDSPTLKVKPNPDVGAAGWRQVAVEVYGGALWNSWLDRDLGLAGRLALFDGRTVLVDVHRPLLRVPQLAIHLDRAVNSERPAAGRPAAPAPDLGPGHADARATWSSSWPRRPGSTRPTWRRTTWWCTTSPRRPGSAPGASCWPRRGWTTWPRCTPGSRRCSPRPRASDDGPIPVFVGFDHEEIGSGSATGAAGPLLETVLTRLAGGFDTRAAAFATSRCLSVDVTHAAHPNYLGHHDPGHRSVPNGGPALKVNANQRYATDAPGAAAWRRACRDAGVPTQVFVAKNTIPCGSTVGPILSTRLGIRTVDVGIPVLSMHSARELCGVDDPGHLAAAATAFLTDAR